MFFEKKIDTRSKESIANFLLDHYRYNTMNSWNDATSYAHCVKVNRLGLTGTMLEKAYEVLDIEGYWKRIRQPIREFESYWSGAYTIGSNGRCGGYLVLLRAESGVTDHQSTCTECGQLNFKKVVSSSCVCGVCGAPRTNITNPVRYTTAKSTPIDHRMTMEDFMDMSMTALKDRAELVRSFDSACDRVRDAFISLCNNYMIVEETVMVPKRVRRFERI